MGCCMGWLCGEKTVNKTYLDIARKVALSSVEAQSFDGSWVYGALHHHQFIDGFHTGFNLEALTILKTALKTSEFNLAKCSPKLLLKQHVMLNAIKHQINATLYSAGQANTERLY